MPLKGTFRFLGALALIGTSLGVGAATVASSSRIHSFTDSYRELQGDETPSYPRALSCDDTYSGFLDLTYTYSIETVRHKDVYQIIHDIEGEILMKLTAVLQCIDKETYVASDSGVEENLPFDREILGVVGIESDPPDRPSELTKCVSANNECTIVLGTLTLLLADDAKLDHVRYASRYVINNAMKSHFFVTPRVHNLLSISYKGPMLIVPEDHVTVVLPGLDGEATNTPDNSGMSIMTKVVFGALFSAIVGIVAGFVLFKKVFNTKQNCFAACDGTGVDRDYIDESHFYSPHRDDLRNVSMPGEDMEETVEYDIANGLTVINEESDGMSASASYAMSTMTGYSNASRFNSSQVSMGWTDAGSVASEKTLPTSNRNRTPMFGKGETERII